MRGSNPLGRACGDDSSRRKKAAEISCQKRKISLALVYGQKSSVRYASKGVESVDYYPKALSMFSVCSHFDSTPTGK